LSISSLTTLQKLRHAGHCPVRRFALESNSGSQRQAGRTSLKEGWEAVIGLEVHPQLKTDSKIFCACSTEFGREPNRVSDE
jgi:hypothetical protein